MDVAEPFLTVDRLWETSVSPGRADLLLAALDPELSFVLIETWDGQAGWHEAPVSVSVDEEPSLRMVRNHFFEVLVTPSEAVVIGAQLHRQGVAAGGLRCFQFATRPKDTFRLPDWSKGRADAMRGLGVEVAIDLAHDGEVAVVWSPTESTLRQFVRRLGVTTAL